MPGPEVFSAQGKRGSLTYLPSPNGPITGSPFSITTTPTRVPASGGFAAGAIIITTSVAFHFRVFREGETIVNATTGDVLLPVVGVGVFAMPVKEGDFMSIVTPSGTANIQISQARTG